MNTLQAVLMFFLTRLIYTSCPNGKSFKEKYNLTKQNKSSAFHHLHYFLPMIFELPGKETTRVENFLSTFSVRHWPTFNRLHRIEVSVSFQTTPRQESILISNLLLRTIGISCPICYS